MLSLRVCKSAGLRVCKSAGLQVCKSTGLQVCKSAVCKSAVCMCRTLAKAIINSTLKSPDDPLKKQRNEDSVGRTRSKVCKASTVSSHLRLSLQPCGKNEIGERLNCLASETRSIKDPRNKSCLG